MSTTPHIESNLPSDLEKDIVIARARLKTLQDQAAGLTKDNERTIKSIAEKSLELENINSAIKEAEIDRDRAENEKSTAQKTLKEKKMELDLLKDEMASNKKENDDLLEEITANKDVLQKTIEGKRKAESEMEITKEAFQQKVNDFESKFKRIVDVIKENINL